MMISRPRLCVCLTLLLLALCRPTIAFVTVKIADSTTRRYTCRKQLWASHQDTNVGSGLYKKFMDHAWETLESSGLFQNSEIPSELQFNQAPAKGMENSIVKITTKALTPKDDDESLVRYSRVALLETVALDSSPSSV